MLPGIRAGGIEPPTPWVETKCSNPLSYARMFVNRLGIASGMEAGGENRTLITWLEAKDSGH